MTSSVLVDQHDLAEEHWRAPLEGSPQLKPLLPGDLTTANSPTCGIATLDASQTFRLNCDASGKVYPEGKSARHNDVACFLKTGFDLTGCPTAMLQNLATEHPLHWI